MRKNQSAHVTLRDRSGANHWAACPGGCPSGTNISAPAVRRRAAIEHEIIIDDGAARPQLLASWADIHILVFVVAKVRAAEAAILARALSR